MPPSKRSRLRKTYADYQRDARRRGLLFDLSFEEFQTLVTQLCAYCGTKPAAMPRGFLGLDRLDNALGYFRANVWPACTRCNRVKSDLLSPQEAKKVGQCLGPWKPARAQPKKA